MIQSELIQLIDDFKERFENADTIITTFLHEHKNFSQAQLEAARDLLFHGIEIYEIYKDYQGAVHVINESIKLFPSPGCFYNRGTIHWHEKNYLEAFKDHCSAIIFEKEYYPICYFYLANSLYELAVDSTETSIVEEFEIIKLVFDILREGVLRGDSNAIQMFPIVLFHYDDLRTKLNNSE